MIHPTAIVDPRARVPESCTVGPFCVIEADVELGEHCELVSHLHFRGPSKIGRHNKFSPFGSIGLDPQDISYRGEPTRLEMGDYNVIHECVTINRGTVKGGGVTRIGSHILMMAYSHVGHDCVVGDNVMLVNNATLGGHAILEEWSVVGALSAVHQFVRVGAHAYVGGGTMVTQDVLPFSKTSASRENRSYGLNSVGLQRRGFTEDRIRELEGAFRILLRSKLNTTQALDKLRGQNGNSSDVENLIRFVESSERGIIK